MMELPESDSTVTAIEMESKDVEHSNSNNNNNIVKSDSETQSEPVSGLSADGTSFTLVLNFRILAWVTMVAFLLVFGIGAILTFTNTEYSREKDVIYRYFVRTLSIVIDD
jgi:hypothetical protein